MENNKSKVLRVVKTIYDIKPKTFVTVIKENKENVFVCKNINKELDLYNPQNDNTRWGLSCEDLDDMRRSLLMDFLEGYFDDIKIG